MQTDSSYCGVLGGVQTENKTVKKCEGLHGEGALLSGTSEIV